MVCGVDLNISLSLCVYLTGCSPYTGENQVDTPVPMHSHRPRCAATSLINFQLRTNNSLFYVLLESCLLHWIQSSQENQTRAEKAYKCPQCGVDYEIESDNPPLLRILNKLNQVLTRTGKITTLVGIGTTVFAFGTCTFLPIPPHMHSS
jgi:hypothetical protein